MGSYSEIRGLNETKIPEGEENTIRREPLMKAVAQTRTNKLHKRVSKNNRYRPCRLIMNDRNAPIRSLCEHTLGEQ
jgi:hypothetical protein